MDDANLVNKVKQEIELIEVGITSQNNLQQVELKKSRKYNIIANEEASCIKAKPKESYRM